MNLNTSMNIRGNDHLLQGIDTADFSGNRLNCTLIKKRLSRSHTLKIFSSQQPIASIPCYLDKRLDSRFINLSGLTGHNCRLVDVKANVLSRKLLITKKEMKACPPEQFNVLLENQLQRIATGNPEESVELWVERIIKVFALSSKDHSDLTIPLHLSVDNAHYYPALQQKIAELIPVEQMRPTVECTIGAFQNPRTVGIIGGVGPIADARLLTMILEELKEQNVPSDRISIQILSSPPPRTFSQVRRHPFHYLKTMRQFLGRNLASYWLGSNTAHLLHSKLQILGNRKIGNLIRNLVSSVKKEDESKQNVLILGTSKAWRKKLYPHAFQKKSLDTTLPSREDQKQIQLFIDRVKAGKKPDPQIFLQYIRSQLKDHPEITDILLGCTELSVALEGIDLQKEFPRHHITDSNLFFAKRIASEIQKNS